MYILRDTFNCRDISRHRTLRAACRADKRYDELVKKHNGQSSYIPTIICKDGKEVDGEEIYQCRELLWP